MRSTGEVMGIARGFGMAFAKAELAANEALPTGGTVFLSTHDRDKQALVPVARRLADEGFSLTATAGTAAVLAAAGLAVEPVLKVHEGRPNIEDAIRSGSIQLIINTPIGRQAAHDDKYLRRAALDYAVPTVTTLAGARAAVEAIAALQQQHLEINALQDIHRRLPRRLREPLHLGSGFRWLPRALCLGAARCSRRTRQAPGGILPGGRRPQGPG
jgi:carbamoyl-phosphate synthase large subunit